MTKTAPRAFALTLATLLGTIAPARAADEAAPTAKQVEEARGRFTRGVELYEEGDYKLALIEFERAYELAPSYRILYNIGEVHLQLGHYAKALRALDRYLQDGGDRVTPQRRADVEADLASVRQRTATLTVHASVPGAAIELDQEPLGDAPQDGVMVDAGEHRLRVVKAGFAADEQTFALAGGDAKIVDVTLVPDRAPAPRVAPSPSRPEAWVAWSAAGALTVGAAVCGALAWKSAADLKDLRDSAGSSQDERQRAADRARTFALATDAAAAGAVVTAAAAIFFTVRSPATERVRTGVGPGSIVVTGTF